MDPVAGLVSDSSRWISLTLTRKERDGKRRAIAEYRSQLLVMPDFLGGFERSNELFVEGDQPVAPCWCAGENISPRASRGR